jgi:hemerythrin-like metal-binding protein
MSGFQWDTRFDLGVAEMNHEHRVLIDKMNKVEELAEKKAGKAVVGRALQELGAYTVQHFTSEEAYMARTGFPGLATHKVVHQSLLEKFTAYVTAFEKGNGDLPEGFISFLHFWLRAHISGVDRKYADHAHAHAA